MQADSITINQEQFLVSAESKEEALVVITS